MLSTSRSDRPVRSHRLIVTLAALAALLLTAVAGTGDADASARHLTAAQVHAEVARVLALAKRYVHHARYVEGGASPKHGFDCSGYTMYVYQHAKAASLKHNAEAQRHQARRVSAKSARAGDLVFYMSGGYAYHVAIYAGHHMQYAAATPHDGIRYQRVWSSQVRYGRVIG